MIADFNKFTQIEQHTKIRAEDIELYVNYTYVCI